MKKLCICLIMIFIAMSKIYTQEEPLLLKMDINDELWLDGTIIVFNGWPPNIRLITNDNYVVGIDDDIPEIILNNLFVNSIAGKFKLKLLYLANIPYYKTELPVLKIIEYKDIILKER